MYVPPKQPIQVVRPSLGLFIDDEFSTTMIHNHCVPFVKQMQSMSCIDTFALASASFMTVNAHSR